MKYKVGDLIIDKFIKSEQQHFIENNIAKEKSCNNCRHSNCYEECSNCKNMNGWELKTNKEEKQMNIILLSGKAQHGKDATAKMLFEKLTSQGKKVLIAHYGDLVKYTCKIFFDWNGEKDEQGRTLLQEVGTDKIRAKHPDFWVDYVKDILEVFTDKWDYVIIPDTRFPNEIDVMKKAFNDVTSIRVVRTNFISPLTNEQRKHRSEIALDDYHFDYYFIADDLETLERKVDNLLENLEGNDESNNTR